MAQNIIYSPWQRTKGPWPCLMTTLLLLILLRLFSFVSAFLTSLIKLTLWLKFSAGKRQAENMVVGARTIRSCFVSKLVSWPCASSAASPHPMLCILMHGSPPGFSVHGILQATILEWVAISFSWGSFLPRDRTQSPESPALVGGFFTAEPPVESLEPVNSSLNPYFATC